VPIHDYGEIDGHFFVGMRLIDGASLRTLLADHGPIAPARAVAIVRQVAAALDAAHAVGVTHRDVKPENILVTADDFAYLVDFGIARAAGDPALTQIGTTVGTYNYMAPEYMAPERFTGNEVTHRADIYSLACVLGECLTGVPPYRTESVERLIAAHLLESAPRPSELRPGQVPPGLDQVIARGMAKNPEERYRTAGDLAAAADDALTAPEQRQAATILREGETATLRANAHDGGFRRTAPPPNADTRAAPVPSAAGGGWREPPIDPPTAADSTAPASRRTAGSAMAANPTSAPLRPRPPGRQAAGKKRKKLWIALGVAGLVLVTAVAVTGYLVLRPSPSSQQATGQTVLPFNGIDFRLSPGGVALDSAGAVCVTEHDKNQMVKYAPGAGTPTVLHFEGLNTPLAVALGDDGSVYVADRGNDRVVKLAG